MSKVPILLDGDPRLRMKCKKVSRIDNSLRKLADDMLETMNEAKGVGLAAPQVGVLIRLFVAQLPDDYDDPMAGKSVVLFNPEVVKHSGEYYPEEGCLSFPGWVANVKRWEEVTVKGRDRNGKEVRLKATRLLGQCFQHEIEHLDGILFVDHVSPDELRRIERETETAAAGV